MHVLGEYWTELMPVTRNCLDPGAARSVPETRFGCVKRARQILIHVNDPAILIAQAEHEVDLPKRRDSGLNRNLEGQGI